MQVVLSTYSLSAWMRETGKTQFDCLQKAKDLGFAGVELVDICPPGGESLTDYATRLRREADRLGLFFANLAIGANFLQENDEAMDREIERLCGLVDAAVILGAPRMRHDMLYVMPEGMTFEGIFDRLVDGCRRVTTYAATRGVVTMIENHGYVCQHSERMLKLYHAVDHPNFGLLTDIGNFMCVDQDPAEAVAQVAPLARYVHAKDFLYRRKEDADPGDGWFGTANGNRLRGTVVGHGIVPVPTCFGLLKAAGYDGPITLEFEGLERTDDAMLLGKANIERIWNEV